MAEVEIGVGKSARLSYGLDQIALVPSRRTRDVEDIDISWQLDAFNFPLPMMAAPIDGIVGPDSAAEIARLGGLGVLNLEGLWTRYEDPTALFEKIAELSPDEVTPHLQSLYEVPISPELVTERIRALSASGAVSAGALTPQRCVELRSAIVLGELDVLVIDGTVVSAEHVSRRAEPLELERFIRDLDIPVIVGGCASYQAARHLMRTGAVGILAGVGAGRSSGTRRSLGIGTPAASAIADVAGARSRHLEETGVYVEVIADGGMQTGGDIAKAIALGADAVMIGSPLASAEEVPGKGTYWPTSAAHRELPRGGRQHIESSSSLERVLLGPARAESGENLFGGLRRSMALCGYASIREFHKAELVVSTEAP